MIDLAHKLRALRYGQIVLDFVNARTVEAGCLKTIEGMQQTSPRFPDTFEAKAKGAFPSLSVLTSGLSQHEIAFFRLRYIRDRMRFDISQMREKETDHRTGSLLEPAEECEQLNRIEKTLDKTKPRVERKRQTDILKMIERNRHLLDGYEDLRDYQRLLRKVMGEITERKEIHERFHLLFFLRCYEEFYPIYPHLAPDNWMPTGPSAPDEESFSESDPSLYELWAMPYQIGIYFAFVEFMKGRGNISKIGRCRHCGNFFISNAAREQKRCPENWCCLSCGKKGRLTSAEKARWEPIQILPRPDRKTRKRVPA